MQVIDALQRGEGTLGGIFCPQTLEMFWPTLQQPAELRTNGCYGWIQHHKGPEITLGGILIVVEGCRQSGGYDRTFERSGLPLSGIVFKWIMIANVMKSAQIQQINLASLNRQGISW